MTAQAARAAAYPAPVYKGAGWGSGTVAFPHGIGANKESFDDQLPVLARRRAAGGIAAVSAEIYQAALRCPPGVGRPANFEDPPSVNAALAGILNAIDLIETST